MQFAQGVARLPFYYGWVIVASMFLLLGTAHGLTLAGIPVFDEVILNELGISTGALKFRDFITVMCAGLSGPLIGYSVDKFGSRVVIFVGLLCLSAALLLYSQITSVVHVYLIHILMGLSFSATNIIVIVVLLSKWFVTKRGIALGFALAGTSVGSAFFPILTANLLGQSDWRAVFQVLATLPVLLIPILFLIVRERPSDLHLKPLGNSPSYENKSSEAAIDMTAVWAQVRTLNFALLAATAALIFYTANAFIQHTFLYLRDRGFEPSDAATGISIIFMAGLLGKILSGFLVEKWSVRKIWIGFQASMFLGAVTIVVFQAAGVWVGLFCIGLGWGGAYSLTQLSISNMFPAKVLGRLMGLFVIIEAVGSGCGSWLTGVLFDVGGSYNTSFIIAACFMVVAMACTKLLAESARAK